MNAAHGADGPWKLWEQPDSHRSRGRVAFQAAIAARNQGTDAFDRFHLALLKAKHEDGLDHGKRSTLRTVAEAVGLDLERFDRDATERSFLGQLADDYVYGRQEYGVFGTPTLVFSNGKAAYLKMRPPAPPEEALNVFWDFVRTVRDRPYITEIKRPTKPES